MKKRYATLFSALFLGGAICASCTDKKDASAEEVINTIHKVNNYWQTNHPEHGRSFWDNAAYHTGNMEAYFLTKQPEYLEYSKAWAEYNEWKGAKSDHKENWKYSYGESDDYVLFGDYQICFQTYADLYTVKPDSGKIARAREVMEYQMSTDKNDYWWWADGLYMVMPVMTKMYKLTGNPLYLEKLHEYWTYANSIMYDAEEGLYYRDGKYIYPKHKSVNGKKDFWARGDGWVLAALAKDECFCPNREIIRLVLTRTYVQNRCELCATEEIRSKLMKGFCTWEKKNGLSRKNEIRRRGISFFYGAILRMLSKVNGKQE